MNDIHLPFRLIRQLRASEDASISSRRPLRRASRLLPLEQRFMFDGAAVATAADAAHAQADTHAAALVAEAAASAHQVREADASRNSGKKEVVFVDTSVANYQTLEAGVRDGVAIVEFDGSKDGLAQIAQWAANQSGYDAIHILSHGSEGTLNLGTNVLANAALASATVQAELADIGRALNADGDLLLYGCDVAAGSDGQRFVSDLAQLTGADVAASVNATGAAGKGGDWILEKSTGKIDAGNILTAQGIAQYGGLLETITFVENSSEDSDGAFNFFTKTINGATFTFSAGSSAYVGQYFDIQFDSLSGLTGIYALSGRAVDSGVDFTVSAQNGYSFDLTGFKTTASGVTSITVYYNGMTTSKTYTITPDSINTLSGLTDFNDVTSVTFTADNFALFQDLEISDVKAIAPTITFNGLALSADTGASNSDFITNTAAQTITATLSGALAGGDIAYGSLDNGTTWTDITSKVSGTTLTWDGVTLSGSGTLALKVTNSLGNDGIPSTHSYALDTTAPAAPSAPDMASGSDTGTSNTDNITKNTTPTFTGTAESGSTVTLYDSDGTTVLGTTTATGGNWSITSSTLAAGNHTVTAKAIDLAGNTSSVSSGLAITIDTTAPTVAISSNVASLKAGESATITFTFSEDPGSTFTWNGSAGDITVSGGTLSAISGSGLTRTATFTPTANTNGGTANISIAAGGYTDAAGNNGGAGIMPSLTFDTLAPAQPSIPDMSSGTDTGTSSTDNVTSNTAPTFTGTAEAGSTVTLYDTDGTTVLGTTTATGGNWSITTSTLSEGAHAIRVKVADAAGNVTTGSTALNITIDTTAPPSVSGIALSADMGNSATDFLTNTTAQTISGTLSANLESGDSVEVSLDNGATWNTATASVGSNTWSYNGTLNGTDPIKVRVVDTAGNGSAVYTQAYVLDTTAPMVNSVSVPTNGTYYNNQSLDFTVHFSEAVTVDTTGGTPRIALAIGTTTVYAYYQSGSGTGDLLFRYTVASGNQDANGITVGTLNINGGSIRDAAGNDTSTTLNSVGSTAGVNVDGTLPQVTAVSSTTPDGIYKAGDTVTVTLDFSKAVTVDTTSGTPTLSLNNGATATYASGSGSSTLVFTYTIGTGQDTADLDYSTIGALALNGATIKDSSGAHQDAALTLSAPGASGSLGANKAIVIDATPPTAAFSGLALSADTGASSSDFITNTAAQTITATLSSALAGGDIVYGSLDNGATWTDITSKVSGTTLTWNGVTLTGSGTLVLKVADAAGNNGPVASQAYTLDTSAPTATVASAALSADTGISGTDFITSTAAQTISGTLSANLGSNDTVQISLDNGSTWNTATASTGGNVWSYNATLAGSNTLQVRVVDAAGNIGATYAQSYVFDTSPPAAPTVESVNTDSLTPMLTGAATLEPGATLTITVDAATYHVTPSAGHWSLDLATAVPASGSPALAAGNSYNVTATVADAAGNTSSATGILAIAATSVPTSPTLPTLPPESPLPPPPPVIVSPIIITPSDNAKPVVGTSTDQPTETAPIVTPFLPPGLDIIVRNSPVAAGTDFMAAALFSPARDTLSANGQSGFDSSLTNGSSFRVVVLPASTAGDGLMLNRGMADQVVQSSTHTEISIPPDAFAHTDPNAAIQLSARQPDGKTLPNWVTFDSRSGKLTIDPPKGMVGEIAVKVMARDGKGKEVATVFRIRVGDKGTAQSRPQAEPAGRAGLSEQIHQAARQRGNADALDHLAELAHAFQWPNS